MHHTLSTQQFQMLKHLVFGAQTYSTIKKAFQKIIYIKTKRFTTIRCLLLTLNRAHFQQINRRKEKLIIKKS